MSITPPEGYLYGTVVFRALKQVVDSADSGREPDVIPATGTITFTPNAAYYKNLTMPATFIPDGIVGTLDAAGYMVDALGNSGVYLMDMSSPGVSPSGMTYRVSMTISGRTFPTFDINVVGGQTIDLTTVMPAATSAGAITIVSEASRVAAEAARDEVIAIRDELIDNPPTGGGGVPDGGTTGQTLKKNSVTNGDVSWVTLVKADVGLGNVDNVSAANLRDRTTHTGVQASTTISDFTEAVQDVVGAFMASGTGATVTYNDAANTITIAATGTSDLEAIRDAIGVALIGVGVISVTVDDTANTITISSTATANSTDAALRDRSTHTGTQAQSTITDLSTDLAAKAPLASPPFTGNPTAPTPAEGDNDTSLATTAFVRTARPAMMFTVVYSSPNWTYKGSTITARPPYMQTGDQILFVGNPGGALPGWATTNDVWTQG